MLAISKRGINSWRSTHGKVRDSSWHPLQSPISFTRFSLQGPTFFAKSSLARPDRLHEGHVCSNCPVTPGSALPCNADGPFHTTGLSQKPSVHFLICACHLDTCAADIGRGPNGLQSVIVLIIWKVLSKQLRDKSHRNIQERRRAEKNTHHLYIYINIYKLSHLSLIGGL